MPICERDPWRFQYFEGIPCPAHVRVPTDDMDCWEWYPRWRWLYDKVNIARSQDLDCGTHAEKPRRFPVFSKPAINLKGMGIGSRVIASQAEFEAARQPGHMWMTLLQGDHISTDCAVVNGACQWLRHTHGLAWRAGMFKYWTIEKEGREALSRYLQDWIGRHMATYTGIVNFETIGGRIIEAHLRFSDQWCDLYGSGWIEALVALYEKGKWTYHEPSWREGCSLILYAAHGRVPAHPSPEDQARIRAMPGVSSVQITYHESRPGEDHPMPPGGFRIGIVNCWDLNAGIAARRALAACFQGCEIMIPE
jgi:hypothetical protein